jgi:hypothetical protein
MAAILLSYGRLLYCPSAAAPAPLLCLTTHLEDVFGAHVFHAPKADLVLAGHKRNGGGKVVPAGPRSAGGTGSEQYTHVSTDDNRGLNWFGALCWACKGVATAMLHASLWDLLFST